MTPAEFRAARDWLGFSLAEMARALKVTERAVRFWEDGQRGIPGPVEIALGFMLLARKPAPRAARST